MLYNISTMQMLPSWSPLSRGVKKGHPIVMEGLNTQLQKSMTEKTRLEEQLKD
jgi:hypothetical protein